MNKLFILSVFLSILCNIFAQNVSSTDNCPSSDLIKPCTCYKSRLGEDVLGCRGLTSHQDIRTIFNRVPGWKFTILYVLDSTMLYFPSSIFENSTIDSIYVTRTTMASLFDEPPKSSALRNIYVEESIFQRGFRWDLVSSLNIEFMMLQRTPVKVLGTSFKNNIPENTKYLWFEKNRITRLVKQPFENLNKLEFLVLRKQSLKKLNSLKFPQSLRRLHLDSNGLETLPDGLFSGLPNLSSVVLIDNKLSTMKEETFLGIQFLLMDDNPLDCNCSVKWIITNKHPLGLISGTCASPDNLKDKQLKKLTMSDFSYCR